METYGIGLFEQHQQKLRSSAISQEIAEELGYVSGDTKAQLERYGFSPAQRRVPALIIPLHGVSGQDVGYQLRPDKPRVVKGRTLKYESRLGQPMSLDVPHRCCPMLRDPKVPLFITEGPLKADALATVGLCAVALLGVWGWRGRNDDGGKVALADWEFIALNDRQVYIAFDSDVMLNPLVHDAMARLSGFLEHRGAKVAFIYLPHGEHGAKVGVDDYLAQGHGADELLSLAVSELLRPVTDVTDVTHPESREVAPVAWEELRSLLDDVEQFLGRYVAFPDQQHHIAATLWAAHTHLTEIAESTPRLAALSPEPGSGKTRLLEVLELICHNSMHSSNLSTAAMFRTIAKYQPTLLMDEIDAVFQGRNAYRHDDLRALVNAGHRRGAEIQRVVGEGAHLDVQTFPVYAPIALAGLGNLPDTIISRSIIIPMRRRRPDEHVEPFRRRDTEPEGHALRDRLEGWANTNHEQLATQRPTMPPGITDRSADVWEPLIAIADAAGPRWAARARVACTTIVTQSSQRPISLGIRLLGDIKTVFEDDERAEIPTSDLIRALHALDETPWGDLGGTGLDARALARFLAGYDIRSTQIRVPHQVRGYPRHKFEDAWGRYLTEPETQPETPAEPNPDPVTAFDTKLLAAVRPPHHPRHLAE